MNKAKNKSTSNETVLEYKEKHQIQFYCLEWVISMKHLKKMLKLHQILE